MHGSFKLLRDNYCNVLSNYNTYVIFDSRYFSVVCVSETKETRECVTGVERVYVDHAHRRQWTSDVSVQSGVVRYTNLSKKQRK